MKIKKKKEKPHIIRCVTNHIKPRNATIETRTVQYIKQPMFGVVDASGGAWGRTLSTARPLESWASP